MIQFTLDIVRLPSLKLRFMHLKHQGWKMSFFLKSWGLLPCANCYREWRPRQFQIIRSEKHYRSPKDAGSRYHQGSIPYMGVSKNRSTPKWMVYNGKPYEQMDDLGGPPLFLGWHPYKPFPFGVGKKPLTWNLLSYDLYTLNAKKPGQRLSALSWNHKPWEDTTWMDGKGSKFEQPNHWHTYYIYICVCFLFR